MNHDAATALQEDLSDIEEDDGDAVAVKERGRMEEEKEYEDGEEGEDEENKTQAEDIDGKKSCYLTF